MPLESPTSESAVARWGAADLSCYMGGTIDDDSIPVEVGEGGCEALEVLSGISTVGRLGPCECETMSDD